MSIECFLFYIIFAFAGFMLGIKLMKLKMLKDKLKEERKKQITKLIKSGYCEHIQRELIDAIGGIDVYNELLEEWKEHNGNNKDKT